jgi:hypothetical protein
VRVDKRSQKTLPSQSELEQLFPEIACRLPKRVSARIGVDLDSRCWPWLGPVGTVGHGKVSVDGRQYQAHRYVYETLRGPIPDGCVLDHLCRYPRCVNPDHLDPVTQNVNLRRGVLSRDHPYPDARSWNGTRVRSIR